MQDVAADLADTIHLAEAAGIADEKIILDPGVGRSARPMRTIWRSSTVWKN